MIKSEQMRKKADEFAEREYSYSSEEREYLAKGYYWGCVDTTKYLGWHSVEESLPPIDEEVIVMWFDYEVRAEPIRHIDTSMLIQPIQCVPTNKKIWTIPGVRYWMSLPRLQEEK